LRGVSTRSDSRAWSESLSFASPESDFVSSSGNIQLSTSTNSYQSVWSQTLSFASPESDFVSASKEEHASEFAGDTNRAAWSESLYFASPESDFVAAPTNVHLSTNTSDEQWSQSLSFASPESDFVAASHTLHEPLASRNRNTSIDSINQELFRVHHLYSSPETAAGVVAYAEMIDETILETVLEQKNAPEPLPKTMEDALHDDRPIVITTAESPFCVIDVNGAWETLCGYRRDEAIGRNLGSLLQGPDTNKESAEKLIHSLKENGFSETIITNYAKNGRRFENHVQIGMISAADDAYFVGVLNDISKNNNQKAAAM